LPQFGDRHLEAALLLLERIDLGDALFAGEVERRVVGAAEQVPDLGEREASTPSVRSRCGGKAVLRRGAAAR
jgi:hypothetical protein